MKVLRKYEKEVKTFKVGDQILIPLAGVGEFTATAHQITDDGILFMFDEYIAKRPMNKKNTNEGGFEKSDLKKWLDTELYLAFPEWLRERIANLSIPTVGQMFGHDDKLDGKYYEPDTNEQLPLMNERRNRVAYFQNDWEWGWLRNTVKKDWSSALFALVAGNGVTAYSGASNSYGVRPIFWLVK